MSLAGSWIVPPGHGPTGGAVPTFQKHDAVGEVFSATLHLKTRPGLISPVTVAWSTTWPFVAVVPVAGETTTVTLLGLNPLPPVPQPATSIRRIGATRRLWYGRQRVQSQ